MPTAIMLSLLSLSLEESPLVTSKVVPITQNQASLFLFSSNHRYAVDENIDHSNPIYSA